MKTLRLVFAACMILALGAYIYAAFAICGWTEYTVLSAILIAGVLTRKQKNFWIASFLLCGYLVLEIIALLHQGSVVGLIIGFCFALAAWDMLLEIWRFNDQPFHPNAEKYIHRHISIGFAAMLSGGLLAIFVINIHFKFPFLVLYLLAIVYLFCLFGILNIMQDSKKNRL